MIKKQPWGHWTKKRLLEEAKKYSSRMDFFRGNKSAYAAAQKKRLLTLICSHMTRVGHKYKRRVYIIVFQNKKIYIGLTYDFSKRFAQHKRGDSRISKLLSTESHTIYISKNLYNPEQASRLESDLVDYYKSKKWNVINKAIAGGLGGSKNGKWTKEAVFLEAQKYDEVSEFIKNCGSGYYYAGKFGVRKEATAHMSRKIKQKGFLKSFENLKSIAIKFQTRTEMQKYDHAAYESARKHHKSSEIFAHMKPKWNTKSDMEIIEIAKRYATKTEFRLREVAAYTTARRRKIIHLCQSHMPKKSI